MQELILNQELFRPWFSIKHLDIGETNEKNLDSSILSIYSGNSILKYKGSEKRLINDPRRKQRGIRTGS